MELTIYLALYLFIFVFDIVPLIKSKRKKSLMIYLPIFTVTLVINILIGLGTKVPSLTAPITDMVSRIFGLQ